MIQVFLTTAIARSITAFGALALTSVIGTFYGPDVLGRFTLILAVLLPVAAACRGGRDVALTIMSARWNDRKRINRLFYRQLIVVATRTLAGIPLFAGVLLLHPSVQINANTVMSIAMMGVALLLFNFSYCVAAVSKAFRRPVLACFLENGAISGIAAGILFLVAQIDAAEVALVVCSGAFLGAALATSIVAFSFERCLFGAHASRELNPHDEKHIESIAKPLLYTAGLSILQAQGGVLFSSPFLGVSELGLLAAAVQLSTALAFTLVVANLIMPTVTRGMFGSRDKMEVFRVRVRGVALLTLLGSLPIFLVAFFVPETLTFFYGEDFRNASAPFLILMGGQFFNVVCGSSGMILRLSGNEQWVLKSTLISTVLFVLLSLTLTPLLGIHGAALAISAGIMAQNVLLVLAVRKQLGFWGLPFLNFRSLQT